MGSLSPMQLGAHLPLIDFDGRGWPAGRVATYARRARDLGYDFVCANDHLAFEKPWLDGIVALASVADQTGDMRLATTVSLPVIRGPVALAKAAAALDIVSGGRLVLGVGPGSSARDYELAGIDIAGRWTRLDESIRLLRTQLSEGDVGFNGRHYRVPTALEPRPIRAGGPPIWVGSWGSEAGLRRVARLGDGWLSSAYHATPDAVAAARSRLGLELGKAGRQLDGFPCALATMWTYVTEDYRVRDAQLRTLAGVLSQPVSALADQVLVGPADACADLLRRYANAGVDFVFVWPIADDVAQLEMVMRDVVPRI